jgi:hypothetical protein
MAMITKEAAYIAIKKSGVPLAILAPKMGLFPQAMGALGMSYATPALSGVGNLLAIVLLATDQYLKYVPSKSKETPEEHVLAPIPRKKTIKFKINKPFTLWGQHFKLEDFMTSCMIVGTSGTGKTSAGFDHFLDKMTRMLDDENPKSKTAKFGGFFLDVKNQFFVRVLYFMVRAGRNPLTDLKVVSPYSEKIIVEWEDPDTGFRFFMNGSHYPTGTACSQFLQGVVRSDGSSYPENLFSVYDSRFEAILEELKRSPLPVGDKKLNLIGWREQSGQLLRVVRNSALDRLEIYKRNGNKIKLPRPRSLRYVRRVTVDTGLRYNVIDNTLPAAAIAQQLMKVARLANGSGGSGGGNDSYWIGSTEAQVINCINLWRIIHGTTKEITGPDILKLSTNVEYLDKHLNDLKEKRRQFNNELLSIKDDNFRKEEIEKSLKSIEAVSDYFKSTWTQKDPKQKNTVEQMIVNLFGVFNNDEHLKRSFCSPSTYNFRECMNDGRIFVLVPGADYSENAKVIGTLLKLHFQKVSLERVDSSTINRNRVVIFGADEVQRYVVAASASEGDADFNNLSRESKIINIVATQTDASIADLIKGAADSYFSSYGIRLYFNVDDPGTRKRGVELCGQTKKTYAYKLKGDDMSLTSVMEGKSQVNSQGQQKEEKSFKDEDFISLKKWESICFNKFAPNHDKRMAVRHQNKPHEYGAPSSEPLIQRLVDWYQSAFIEQCLYEQGNVGLVDHDQHVELNATTSEESNENSNSADNQPDSQASQAGSSGMKNPDPETERGKEAQDMAAAFEAGGDFGEDLPEDSDGEAPRAKKDDPHPDAKETPQEEFDLHRNPPRPRSPVGAKVHRHRSSPIERGLPKEAKCPFADEDLEPTSDQLAPNVTVEQASGEDFPNPTVKDNESKSAKTDDATPQEKLHDSIQTNFGEEGGAEYLNEYAIAEMVQEQMDSEKPYGTIDEVVTAQGGFASDKDDAPAKNGMTIIPAGSIDIAEARNAVQEWMSTAKDISVGSKTSYTRNMATTISV